MTSQRGGTSDVNMAHNNDRCMLCGLTLYPGYSYGEVDLTLHDNVNKVRSTHQGILICKNCHDKIITECGMS